MPGKGKKKGKKGSKKKAKKEEEHIPDEFDLMDEEQLNEEVKKSTAKLNEIRRNRNYYLIERDQVQEFHEIVHGEVVKTESHIRNIESQMEKMQDTHRNDIRIYLQKVIHLEYEHAKNVDAVQSLGERDRGAEEGGHLKRKADLKKMKLQLKADLKQEELDYEIEIKNIQETESRKMTKLREEFEELHVALMEKSEQRLQDVRDGLELRRKMEIHEIEERKHRHINDLMDNFEQAFTEMRNYYNSITQDNLALIKSLNEEIEDLKAKHAQNEKNKEEIARKNAQLQEPLEATEKEVRALQHKLQNYDKDKVSLKHAQSRLLNSEAEMKRLQDEQNRLRQQYTSLELERDTLYQTFEQTVHAVRGRSEARNEVLEKMLDEYKDIFEVKKAQFTSVLRASNLDPMVLQNVTKKLDDVLTSKNEQIQELRYEIAKIQKAHDDLIRVYDSKLQEFGIPTSELGLDLYNQTGTAPADLICV